METIKDRFSTHILLLQDTICRALELTDGKATFREDKWSREGGGGGRTRVIAGGNVFEKGGVNTSAVDGVVTPVMREQLKLEGEFFFATGLSLVIHPVNPFVPTVHANFRYFELYDAQHQVIDSWFGGGLDLTPYYLFHEDARHFHQVLKQTCDRFDTGLYPSFKNQCDNYFVNRHRKDERRGIGGIFYDYLRKDQQQKHIDWLDFSCGISLQFLPAYIPIVEKRMNAVYTEEHKYWQEIRRGRYVEFNLLHDKGTLFGLKTNGRTDSILMSLPPTVRFEYDYEPAANTPERTLLDVCLEPITWA